MGPRGLAAERALSPGELRVTRGLSWVRRVMVVPSLPLDDENRPLFTVGQVSEMLEVQQAFLRRLDEFMVVSPSRSAGGQRRYTRNEIIIVRYVAQLMDNGMTLPAIRRILQLESRVRELEAERDALRAALAELRAYLGGTGSA
jgi:MerR family transcriptional regulator/heat shock protein HspR